MQVSCSCRPRQTLAERINAIIEKYEKCSCSTRNPEQTITICLPKIFSSPCLKGSTCPSCSPPFPCPAIPSSSCCPQSTILPQPSPGPALTRYISRKEICPSLRSCLSLYKHACCRSKCPTPQITRCSPSVSCSKSKPNCNTVINTNSKSRSSASSSLPCTTRSRSSVSKCQPSLCCSSSPSNYCCRCNATSSDYQANYTVEKCTNCNPCCSSNIKSSRSQCCNYYCNSTSPCFSLDRQSSTSNAQRKRLTALDDPPYTSYNLEREFSGRFIRLDNNCCCETDSSSSMDTSNFGNRCR